MLIDNEINDKERKIVEDHLLQCSACQKELKILEFLNSIGKAEIFDDLESEYWQELTANIMKRIRPAKEKLPIWHVVLEKIGDVISPERINYRIVGLAAATIIMIFFVKISFFNQGKFNLPMEMDEIETIINEPNAEETIELTEVEEEAQKPEEEKISGKNAGAKLSDKKNAREKTPKTVDGVRLASRTKEKAKYSIPHKSGKRAMPLNSDGKLKQLPEKKGKEATKKKTEIAVEREVSSFNLAVKDKSFIVEKAVQKKPMETEVQKQLDLEPMGGIKTRHEEAQQMEMAVQPPTVPADSKLYVPAGKKMKTGAFEYQSTEIQVDNSISKQDSFVIVLKEIKSKSSSEDKVKLLKAYLKRYPKSVHKNQAVCLLAENLVQLAKETKTETNIKDAVEFFHKNEISLKTFDNYEMLKKEVKKLEK